MAHSRRFRAKHAAWLVGVLAAAGLGWWLHAMVTDRLPLWENLAYNCTACHAWATERRYGGVRLAWDVRPPRSVRPGAPDPSTCSHHWQFMGGRKCYWRQGMLYIN